MTIPVAPLPPTNQIYPPIISAALAAALVALNLQSGTATLVAGTITVSGVTLTANSVLCCGRKVAGGTAGAGGLMAPNASRNVGAGTFVINAVDLAGALVTTDTSQVDWMILG